MIRERDKIDAVGLGPESHKTIICPVCDIHMRLLTIDSSSGYKFTCTQCGATADPSWQIAKHASELQVTIASADKGEPVAVFDNSPTPNIKKQKVRLPESEEHFIETSLGGIRTDSKTFLPESGEVQHDID